MMRALRPIKTGRETGYAWGPPAPWNNAWEELYFEAAWRGQNRAILEWKFRRMDSLRTFVGDDLAFVLAPFSAHGRELLQQRLKFAWDHRDETIAINLGRRKAKVTAQLGAFELLDDVEVVAKSKEIAAGWEADPIAVARRYVRKPDNRPQQDPDTGSTRPSRTPSRSFGSKGRGRKGRPP